MTLRFLTIAVLTLAPAAAHSSFGDDARQAAVYVELANQHYEARRKDLARKLYEQAAMRGSAEGHFALAYRYVVDYEAGVHHLTEAAVRGHGKALYTLLERLLFRAESLTKSNPSKAWEVYQTAKRNHPGLSFYGEENAVKTMKMCIEAPPFDVSSFIEKYQIDEKELGGSHYGIWVLAEEASRGGRFGEPDPALVFNLVIRGSSVPAECHSAVAETYRNWKSGTVRDFNIWNHVTSAYGSVFIVHREEKKDAKDRVARLAKVEDTLPSPQKPLVGKAYAAAYGFIEQEARVKEQHTRGMLWDIYWIRSSQMEQRNQFVETVEKIAGGYKPELPASLDESDTRLNETYWALLAIPVHDGGMQPFSNEEIRSVQRLWIPYRDASAALFHALNPSVPPDIWKAWLTDMRSQQFQQVIDGGAK